MLGYFLTNSDSIIEQVPAQVEFQFLETNSFLESGDAQTTSPADVRVQDYISKVNITLDKSHFNLIKVLYNSNLRYSSPNFLSKINLSASPTTPIYLFVGILRI